VAHPPRTGTRVALPDGAQPPYAVYLNGTAQQEPADYVVDGPTLVFSHPLVVAARPEGIFKKLVMSTAGIGFYPKVDAVDVHFHAADGSPGVASGLQAEPDG
jgi:hypothetical protein